MSHLASLIDVGRSASLAPLILPIYPVRSVTDGIPRVQKIEGMRAFQNVVVCRQHIVLFKNAPCLGFIHGEEFEEHFCVGDLEVVVGVLYLALVVHIAVPDVGDPLEIVHALDFLDEHGDALDTIGDFSGDKVHVDTPTCWK